MFIGSKPCTQEATLLVYCSKNYSLFCLEWAVSPATDLVDTLTNSTRRIETCSICLWSTSIAFIVCSVSTLLLFNSCNAVNSDLSALSLSRDDRSSYEKSGCAACPPPPEGAVVFLALACIEWVALRTAVKMSLATFSLIVLSMSCSSCLSCLAFECRSSLFCLSASNSCHFGIRFKSNCILLISILFAFSDRISSYRRRISLFCALSLENSIIFVSCF